VATIDGQPDGYVVPKVQSAGDIHSLERWLTAAEQARGWIEGSIRLLAIIETALGVVNLREIATSSPRLEALIFGAEDLAGDMGAVRTPEGWESFYARSAVVLHAKAFSLDAIDSPFTHLDDQTELLAETERALQLGYTGKLAIHPRQVEPIQQIFTPSPEEVSQALMLITAHESHQAAGRGVFQHEGKMIDMPMIQAARGVVARAQACRGR
jgi:citrate lyase beta subunit